jgi:hypothetical protein
MLIGTKKRGEEKITVKKRVREKKWSRMKDK